MQQAESSLAGVAFHCYAGTFTDQADFTSQFPSKEVYFTECTGEYGSDWWSDIKVRHPPPGLFSALTPDAGLQWYMDNMWVQSFLPSINFHENAADFAPNPKLHWIRQLRCLDRPHVELGPRWKWESQTAWDDQLRHALPSRGHD